MWCIGALTEDYRQRMYDVLELYARPYRASEPVICIDEKSKQLIRDSRAPLPMKLGMPAAKYDYEYVRSYSRRTRWPGPFGATINTFTSAGGTIFLK